MSTDEFVILLFSNVPVYIGALVLSILCMLPVWKATYKGVLDPLFYAIIMAALANAVPIFLVLMGKILIKQFIFIFLAEFLFWLGFVTFNKPDFQFKKTIIIENEDKDFFLFLCVLFVLIILRVSVYIFVGIPLLAEGGRLGAFSNSGGLGILDRLASLPTFFCSFYSFRLIERKHKYKLLGFFTLLLIVVFSFLSGAKSSVLIIVGAYFYYSFFYNKKIISLRKMIWLIPLLLLMPITILTVSSSKEGFGTLLSLLMRFVANGDVYFMAFPYNTVDNVVITNRFTYFFGGILLPMRVIEYGSVDIPIGFQLNWNLHFTDALSGPNTRLPVLSWIFFKWGGLIFSFLSGVILSVIYNYFSKLFSSHIINFIIVSYIQYNLLIFITDPVLFVGYIFDLLINLFLFYIIYFLINVKFVVYKKVDT